MVDDPAAAKAIGDFGLGNAPRFSDPERRLYRVRPRMAARSTARFSRLAARFSSGDSRETWRRPPARRRPANARRLPVGKRLHSSRLSDMKPPAIGPTIANLHARERAMNLGYKSATNVMERKRAAASSIEDCEAPLWCSTWRRRTAARVPAAHQMLKRFSSIGWSISCSLSTHAWMAVGVTRRRIEYQRSRSKRDVMGGFVFRGVEIVHVGKSDRAAAQPPTMSVQNHWSTGNVMPQKEVAAVESFGVERDLVILLGELFLPRYGRRRVAHLQHDGILFHFRPFREGKLFDQRQPSSVLPSKSARSECLPWPHGVLFTTRAGSIADRSATVF